MTMTSMTSMTSMTITSITSRGHEPSRSADGGRSCSRQRRFASWAAVLFGTLLARGAVPCTATEAAGAGTAEERTFFETQVRPLLARHCLECHGAESHKGGLRLDSRAAMLRGGESGEPAVVPEDPDASPLISAVRYESYEMPPQKQLGESEVATLVEWVRRGAPWPGGDDATIVRLDGDRITAEDRTWWAVQPVVDPPVPTAGAGWARNAIDRFVAARLEAAGLEPAPEADRHELVRRAYYDLHGLPPTPEQIEAFVTDDRSDAWPRLIRELLASPRYGERWAQHWLDVVRYAESDGYNEDAFRPEASAFRDYVVRSFNDDKPYDRFVREHLAGDEIAPADPEVFIGTAFLRHGVYEWNQRNAAMQWDIIIHEMTRTTGEAFLGIGIGCAQCHDHKFDPILQQDYYGLQAFLSSVAWPMDRPLATPEAIAAFEERQRGWEAATEAIRTEMDALTAPHREGSRKSIVSQFPPDIQEIYHKPENEKTTYEKQLSYLVWRQVDRAARRFDAAKALKSKPETLERYTELEKELAAFADLKPASLPTAFVATDYGAEAAPTFLTTRTTRREVQPAFLTLLGGTPVIEPREASTGRRTALADWIADAANPLSTRVIVNRLWQRHFGRGIVATPNDFGTLGEAPSHPELLDWLTSRFLEGGWRLKALHELVMNSAAYRQTARREPSGLVAVVDPGNRLLWRFPPQRLDAEQVRDAMLAISGELRHRDGGPAAAGSEPCRSIFVKKMRNRPDEMLCGFDAPLGFESAPDRIATTTPTQSLLLVNGDWALARAEAFARRLLAGKERLDAGDIERAYRLAFNRPASATEVAEALNFLGRQAALVPAPVAADPFPKEHGLRPIGQHFGAVQDLGLGGRTLWLQPGSRFERLQLEGGDGLDDQFTVEAVATLDRVYADASVNTLFSRWNGNSGTSGWALGVTSAKSAYQPQSLIVQLTGRTFQDEPAYDVVASGLRVPLNTPVYLAAVISAKATPENPTGGTVEFFLRNLADPRAKLERASVETTVVSGIQNPALQTIVGGRLGKGHLWDGQLARLVVSRGALAEEHLLIGAHPEQGRRLLDWVFDGDDGERPAPGTAWLRNEAPPAADRAVAMLGAVTDFCHALFNASEFLYLH